MSGLSTTQQPKNSSRLVLCRRIATDLCFFMPGITLMVISKPTMTFIIDVYSWFWKKISSGCWSNI